MLGVPTVPQEIIKTLIAIFLHDNKCFKCFLFLLCCKQIRGCVEAVVLHEVGEAALSIQIIVVGAGLARMLLLPLIQC